MLKKALGPSNVAFKWVLAACLIVVGMVALVATEAPFVQRVYADSCGASQSCAPVECDGTYYARICCNGACTLCTSCP